MSLVWHPQIYSAARIFITPSWYLGRELITVSFYVPRYREELHAESSPQTALRYTMKEGFTGALGSAITSIVGIGLMGFADFGKFQSAGYAVSVCLVVTLMASVTLAPAILNLLGKAAFWPVNIASFREASPFDDEPSPAARRNFAFRFWDSLSRSLVERPLVWWLVGMSVLVIPIYWGSTVENRTIWSVIFRFSVQVCKAMSCVPVVFFARYDWSD